MTFTGGLWKEDTTYPVSLLPGGVHYTIYYYLKNIDEVFPFAQVYPVKMMERFEPTDKSSFKTLGVNEIWQADGGD